MSASELFSPLTIGDVTFSNRAWVSPMCQYSAGADGVPLNWHLIHLGQFAMGGTGLILTEATSVSPEGRLSPHDTGLWNDEQAAGWKPIVDFVHEQGTHIGVQLVHSGRKASTSTPWSGTGYIDPAEGGWSTLAPSPIAFSTLPEPHELTIPEIERITGDFVSAAQRALDCGFDVVELHAAHGYLLNQFLSPLSNQRTDGYGGDFDGRTRMLREVVTAVREVWAPGRPLFVRVSATDWAEGGWDIDDTVRLSVVLKDLGVDLIDCSTGGIVRTSIPIGAGYQVPFAAQVKAGSGITTSAVGLITDATQAETIIRSGQADAVMLGRAVLRDPHWVNVAAEQLGAEPRWPNQYAAARG
ncbi:NADH:flavin oxidoreductase/NADH oxidase [Salinibacterium sp. UTAS2018]|uniref:NADH:flavin oxidoreductase/NADH oxidase n=1 Tax=Salinibacterium sp. UTAS2018 TaxID=2508880 RepID=UPI0010097452|nr:NADH:flavin oxidoreductase/NADH oxidase [Salinibacterium sp. UTAS2018]QAV70796.1 NADH:flavin oxidoreductase/NADH oxidase [Salinibacterium sp. UTAS2018]